MKILILPLLLLAASAGAAEPRVAEFINEHAPYPECHAATIAEVAPGRLVAAWFGGTRECDRDVCILGGPPGGRPVAGSRERRQRPAT